MPDEINAVFFQIWVWKIMVEQSYAEEPRGECAEDSAVTAKDRSVFAIFTVWNMLTNCSGFMRLFKQG